VYFEHFLQKTIEPIVYYLIFYFAILQFLCFRVCYFFATLLTCFTVTYHGFYIVKFAKFTVLHVCYVLRAVILPKQKLLDNRHNMTDNNRDDQAIITHTSSRCLYNVYNKLYYN